MHYARAFLAVLCIAILLVAPVAFAADFTFTDGNATGVWHDQDNWFDGVSNGIPDVGDTATIPASKICKVEAAQAEACDSLTVQDGGKLEVNAAGGSLTVDDFTVEDGGMIEIFGGGLTMYFVKRGGDIS